MESPDRDRVSRPYVFERMEGLVREMLDPVRGIPVRVQKQFLTSVPASFMGYDILDWLTQNLKLERPDTIHLANQLCIYGYIFPVNDWKNLVVRDDSCLFRFQSPYYWPCQSKSPDKVEYAIYLAKRTLRNKQRHGLEDYEVEALASLKKNLQNKWDFITMQAEEQVRLAKEAKKVDKIISDSQERAFWRIYRPPPGYSSCLEPVPVPNRTKGGCQKKKTVEDLKREVEFLQKSLSRTRIKVSTALDNLAQYADTFMEYDSFFTAPQPSNPWLSDDPTFWQLNNPIVEVPTEKRVKRWAVSMEDLVSDPTGLQEFTNYLRKQFSHENIRFWMAVNDLRRSSQHQIAKKVQEIFDEFLAPGAPCEINIDGKTMEKVHQEMKNPSRFTFDSAAEHVYTLLLKKDCYPRFIRSEHYKNLLAAGVQPSHKKRFFGFGGPTKKKSSTTAPNATSLQQQPLPSTLGRRRDSDRSLTGSANELAVCGVSGHSGTRVGHSHSQSNLSDVPYRGDLPCQSESPSYIWSSLDPQGSSDEVEYSKKFDDICPWDSPVPGSSFESRRKKLGSASCSMASEDVWESDSGNCLTTADPRAYRKNSSQIDSGSSSSELSLAIVEVSERLRKSCGIHQQSSLSVNEESKSRRVSIASGGKNESRRSSTSFPRVATESGLKLSPDRSVPELEAKSQTPESTGTSVSSTNEASVIFPITAAMTLPQQVPAVPQQPPMADTLLDAKNKDNKLETDNSKTFKKSQTGARKKSSSAAPLISVSSVGEDVPIEIEETPSPENKTDDAPEPASSDKAEKSPTSAEAGPRAPSKEKSIDQAVCPWEDEENCKVDGSFVKTYATLGYL